MSYDNGKYKVVKTITQISEKLPAAFLAESVEDAERVYCEFSPLLNSMSYAYHKNTGLDKADLFGEGLMGLAKAIRDFDPDRGSNFNTYAIFRIKDAMNKLVRELNSPVKIPSYIKKANALICELKNYLTYDNECIIVDKIPMDSTTKPILAKLNNYAKRSGLCLKTLMERAEYLPNSCEYVENRQTSEKVVFDKILVNELKEHMTEKELIVVEGFLNGKNFSTVSAECGKSPSWAQNTFDRMCVRLKDI